MAKKCSTIIIEGFMDKGEYLKRIKYSGEAFEPTSEGLSRLQRAHLLSVPFENLDIHWGTEIRLDLDGFYKKIVEDGRGGFCYELNGCFNELLRAMGFETKIVSARVANGKGGFGPEYDHLAIIASIHQSRYLVDVGFGDFIAEPLRLVLDVEQDDPNGTYRITELDEDYLEVQKRSEDSWKSEYIFKNFERELGEFAEMCVHNQKSPESHFTKGKLCSLMTQEGRKTLTDKKFITTVEGEKTEMEVFSNEEFNEVLLREFAIKGQNRLP